MSESKIDKLEKMLAEANENIALLSKAVDQGQLARLTKKKGGHGRSIRIRSYRENLKDDPKLVTSWQMVKNEAMVDRSNGKIVEDQRIQLNFLNNGDNEELEKAKGVLARSKTPEAIQKWEAEVEKLESESVQDSVEMSYGDFMMDPRGNIVFQEVDVVGSLEEDGKNYLLFDWNGDREKILIDFVN